MDNGQQMQALNPIQRYTIYCILLEEAERPSTHIHPVRLHYRQSTESGLCFMLTLLFGYKYEWYHYGDKLLPEYFQKYREEVIHPGIWGRRIEILKECIKELEPVVDALLAALGNQKK